MATHCARKVGAILRTELVASPVMRHLRTHLYRAAYQVNQTSPTSPTS